VCVVTLYAHTTDADMPVRVHVSWH